MPWHLKSNSCRLLSSDKYLTFPWFTWLFDQSNYRKPGKVQSNADDDEEIPSDTDDEQVPEKKQEPVHFGVKRKIKMENYPEFLAKRHKDFQTFR